MNPSPTFPGVNHQPAAFRRWLANANVSTIYAVSGAMAGMISGVAVCPFDVAKTKLQAQGGLIALNLNSSNPTLAAEARAAAHQPKYHGIVGTLKTIVAEDGPRGLYKGLVPIMLGYLPTWMVYFSAYESTKNHLNRIESLGQYAFVSHMLAAITAGSLSTISTNPIWVVKTRLMSQGPNTPWQYKGTLDAIRTMYRREGIWVFYSGLGPALLGLVHVAIQFPLYERFKKILECDKPGNNDLGKNNMIPNLIMASSLSKMCASSITYPHEVIRTRMQIQTVTTKTISTNKNPEKGTAKLKYRGIYRTFKILLREEGWRIFYSGFGTNLIRTVPSSAITLVSFELVSEYMKDIQQKERLERIG
ncbi:mitochondrial carrier [Nadsonia fulvescens var. elongata DSM 6958]|uniref:Mitochondrial carrier n=1 Tax=Nadsonia fulvescens var. elongata DSM 6958 TaxID=857566 RepID=A0A1E3PSZ8_9ASCO|nr:mitochondrial carrier [Nadsonia fulvescens var. elongata DSM 6958]